MSHRLTPRSTHRAQVALAKRKAAGQPVSRPAFGLVRQGKGEDFKRDSETWPTVARILSERSAGHSCQAIADGLNEDGVPTPTAARGERRGLVTGPGKWHAATVARLCRNPYVLALAED